MSAPTIAELRKLSDDDLISRHDRLAQSTQLGLGYYLDELNRRAQDHQTDRMVSLTRWITILTVVVTVATIANAVIAIIMLRKM